MKRLCILLMALMCFAAPSFGQEDDKGFLTRKLQEVLSGAGRDVQIEGFSGSLSSQATMTKMTIADSEGIWLTLDDVVLDWNRSALLRGRVEVEKLTAKTLTIPRAPKAESSTLPSPEAEPFSFSLPELPVSIDIKELAITRIDLGQALVGQPLAFALTANAQLNEGSGATKLIATRLDAINGEFAITGSFDKETEALALKLDVVEEAGGIISTALALPDTPSVALRLDGAGPLSNFASTLMLSTAGTPRLSGDITLLAVPEIIGARRLQADVAGDVTALFAPQYAPFFGDDLALVIDATRLQNGALNIPTVSLKTAQANLSGQANLTAGGWPNLLQLEGQIQTQDGRPVLLPVSGGETQIDSAELGVTYDASRGDRWTGVFDVMGMKQGDVTVDSSRIIANGTLSPNTGGLGKITADILANLDGIAGLPEDIATALGKDVSLTTKLDFTSGQPLSIPQFALRNATIALSGKAQVDTFSSGFETVLDATLTATDLSRLSGLIGQPITGAADLELKGNLAPLAGTFDLDLNGQTDELTVGIDQVDPLLQGTTQLSLSARRDTSGTFVEALNLSNPQMTLIGDASLASQSSTADLVARINELSLIERSLSGPLDAKINATQNGTLWNITTDTSALSDMPTKLSGTASVDMEAPMPATFDVQITSAEIAPFAGLANRAISGAVDLMLTGDAEIESQSFDIVLKGETENLALGIAQADRILRGQTQLNVAAKGDTQRVAVSRLSVANENIQLSANGDLSADRSDIDYDVSLRDTSLIAPGIRGPLKSNGTASLNDDVLSIKAESSGPYGATARASGIATGPDADLAIAARLPNIGVFVPELSGPLSADVTLRRAGDQGYRINADVTGTNGIAALVSGLINDAGRPSLQAQGSLPLGLANPFIAPRTAQGTARFDLSLNGGFALANVAGQITTQAARISAPTLRTVIENITTNITLANSRATVNLNGAVQSGGQITVSGPVGLSGNMLADLSIGLDQIVLSDPSLYQTSVNGALSVTGPLANGARISGNLSLGETNIKVPETGLSGVSEIPDIAHIGASDAVVQTQSRAGLLDREADKSATASGAGFPLNINVSAPSRIFVRGRGLDAELGGQVQVTGTTNAPITVGRFDLIRGRLSILQQRFDLDEGSIRLQGGLVPFIRFVAITQTSTGTASVIIDGAADAPEISFASVPDRPQDEVLAQLLFGRDISQISAFQALQLANAVATLAGRGGEGVISKLRGSFGLDDLDIQTQDDGTTAVRAGKYISDNVYTDVTTTSEGDSEVSINIDLSPNLTVKGSTNTDGNTGVGLFFEKDY